MAMSKKQLTQREHKRKQEEADLQKAADNGDTYAAEKLKRLQKKKK